MPIDEHDKRTIYCRQLGCMIPFKYCRTVSQKMPCRTIADCWHEYLEIVPFLEENYTPEQISSFLRPSHTSKAGRLVEMAEKSRQTED